MPVLSEKVRDMLIGAISGATVQDDPFEHLVFDKVFSDDAYRELLEHLPSSDYYQPQTKRSSKAFGRRLLISLNDEGISGLPDDLRAFWAAYMRGFGDKAVQKALVAKFHRTLRKRFLLNDPSDDLEPELGLFRDRDQYGIPVHRDKAHQVIQFFVYLAKDGSQRHMGTTLNYPKARGFQQAKKMVFLPNHGFAFPVSNRSWHSLDQLRGTDQPRDLIRIYYNLRQGQFRSGLFRLHQTLYYLWK